MDRDSPLFEKEWERATQLVSFLLNLSQSPATVQQVFITEAVHTRDVHTLSDQRFIFRRTNEPTDGEKRKEKKKKKIQKKKNEEDKHGKTW